MIILSLILFIILGLIGLLHFYWAFGGKWNFDNALPTNEEGIRLFTPKPYLSFSVGLILTSMALFYLHKSGYIEIPFPNWIDQYLTFLIGSIFFIRAIGNFSYVGFTKKFKTSTFAKNDTKFYSPLCLVISVLAFFV